MTTLLIAEHDNKVLKDSTNKALTAAKALGEPVHVLVAGLGRARRRREPPPSSTVWRKYSLRTAPRTNTCWPSRWRR